MFEDKKPNSPYIELIWRAQPSQDGVYANIATEFWSLFFEDEPDNKKVYLVGPAAIGRDVPYVTGGKYWGIVFKAHVFMVDIEKRALVGKDVELDINDNTFIVSGQSFTVPGFDDALQFVDQLVERGVITVDNAVAKALAGADYMSRRSVQRHVVRTVGMPQSTIIKVERARQAFMLLQEGRAIADVVEAAGYTDQAHLTKSLRLLAGMTPRQILQEYPFRR